MFNKHLKIAYSITINFFSKNAIEKLPKLGILLHWGCHTRNERSQFLTKLTVSSKLYDLMWK